MVKKIKPDGSRTIYVGGIYEVDKSSGGAVTHTRVYYPAGGAMRVGGTLYYVLKDHLGSASVVTNSTGTDVGGQRYYPFGETRFTTGTMYTDKLFTGQREMAGLGIYHYGARFFSPKLGRFLSPDTIVPGYANPQALNRYSYVLNMPVSATDPSGHKCVGEVGECTNNNGTPINGSGNSSGYTPPVSGNNGGVTKKPKKNGGGGGDEGGGDGNNDTPPGHNYDAGPHSICLDLPWIDCTETEVAGYLSQFQYPGQWPGSPVVNRGEYNVAPAEFWGIPTPLCYIGMCDSGAIRVDITNNGLTLKNITQISHIFYVGDVKRTASQSADGNWSVTTHGQGTNDGYGILPGSAIDYVNQEVGPAVFGVMDIQMVVYTTMVETGQYISSFLP